MQISHRERVQRVEFKHCGRPPSPDEKVLQLLECIRSGQVEPDQYVAHVEAGDLNQGASDGRTEN